MAKAAERAKRHSEDELLQRAFRALSFKHNGFCFTAASGDVYYAYDKHDYFIAEKVDSIAKLGEIAVFDNPGVDGIEAVKNSFFGVKSTEELAVRLDLMGA